MRTKLIGIGAAGNKSAIAAVEDKVIGKENVLLINSTMKDIPADYKGDAHCFTNAYGGCGKERSMARGLMTTEIQTNDLNLMEFLGVETPEEAELVVIVSSTEGGTGSGASPILGQYINDVFGINVHCFAFMGFENDGRGLRNTVEYMQEMQPEFAVEIIQNSKYLDENNGNKIKAEMAANADFCRKLSILMGNPLRDSSHNIDQMDLLKTSTESGYMMIEFKEFKKIKNKQEFRAHVQSMIDESKTLDTKQESAKKLAVMINIDESNTDVIDYLSVFEDNFGVIFDKYEHIQHEKDMPEFVAFIISGLKIPMGEIKEIYDKYKDYTSRVDKSSDSFFAQKDTLVLDQQDEVFNIKKKKTVDASAFFNGLNDKKFGKTQVAVESVNKNISEEY